MHDFKYFDPGYPPHPKLPRYGLYHPVFDCFLIIVDSESIATTLKHLLSSRYVTHVTCLNTADNYNYNLIDNNNCELWTIDQPIATSVLVSLSDLSSTDFVDQLIPADIPSSEVINEKQWALLCLHWIKKILLYKKKNLNFINTDTFLNKFLNIDCTIGYQAGYDSSDENAIFKILYLEKDFFSAEQQLKHFEKIFFYA